MKRFCQLTVALLLVFLLAAGVASCGGKSENVTVTFIVEETEYRISCRAGLLPIFTGNTDKASDGTYLYDFAGWFPDLAPAKEGDVYHAKYRQTRIGERTVVFDFGNGETRSYSYMTGDMPTPPSDFTGYATASTVYTLVGWEPELASVREDVTYTARYTATPRTYTVTYDFGGKTETKTVSFGDASAYAGIPSVGGKRFLFWYEPFRSVTEDVTYHAIFASGVNAGADALRAALDASVPSLLASGDAEEAASAIFALAAQESESPVGGVVCDRLTADLRALLNDEDLTFTNGDVADTLLCAAFALARKTGTVWNALGDAERAKADLWMRATLYRAASDADEWSHALLLAFAADYFTSADAVRATLAAYDAAAFQSELADAGWQTASAGWEVLSVPRDVIPYSHTLDDLPALFAALVGDVYAAGEVVSDTRTLPGGADGFGEPLAYLPSPLSSPAAGDEGMMRAFCAHDASGFLSSVTACERDFVMTTAVLTASRLLGVTDLTRDAEIYPLVKTGNLDFLYKRAHGYVSYADGGVETPRATGGFDYFKNLWLLSYDPLAVLKLN